MIDVITTLLKKNFSIGEISSAVLYPIKSKLVGNASPFVRISAFV